MLKTIRSFDTMSSVPLGAPLRPVKSKKAKMVCPQCKNFRVPAYSLGFCCKGCKEEFKYQQKRGVTVKKGE